MKLKQAGKTKKKNRASIGRKTFWQELKEIASSRLSKTEFFRLFGQLNTGLNALLGKDLPSIQVYMKRTQRKVDRFFIRQNRLSVNKRHQKLA